MELHERVEQIKGKILDVVESRVNESASIEELKDITYVLNQVADDKNLYLKLISSISGNGFNGSANSQLVNTVKAEQ